MHKQAKLARPFVKKQLTWYSFITVGIITLSVLGYIPMMTTIKYSLYDVLMLGFGEEFNGLTNYKLFLNNNSLLKSLANTLILAFMGLLSIPLGFTLASLANSIGKGIWQRFFRVGYYFPNIITGVSVTLVLQVVLKTNHGMLNSLLSSLTGHEVATGWLSDSRYAQFGVTIPYARQNLGYSMLINLANLQSVPQETYEAMEVDGANGLQRWSYITIPRMKICFAFLLITGMINGPAGFTDLFITGGNSSSGHPGGTLQTILMFVYQFSFESPQYEIASADAIILFVTTFIVTAVNLLTIGSFKKEQG